MYVNYANSYFPTILYWSLSWVSTNVECMKCLLSILSKISFLKFPIYHWLEYELRLNASRSQWISKCVGSLWAFAARLEPNEGWQHDSGEKWAYVDSQILILAHWEAEKSIILCMQSVNQLKKIQKYLKNTFYALL